MSGDLISLRVLVVAGDVSVHETWQKGVGQVSLPVQIEIADGERGTDVVGTGGIDICIVDHGLPEAELAAVIRAGHSVRPRPFIVVAAPRGTPRIDGVDAMVPQPADATEAYRLGEICARARIPVRTLIVDDSVTTRRLVRKILNASRFVMDVHEASEGNVALRQLRSGRFGVVFLDYNMPGLSGFDTLSEIRRANPDVAVVMITSTSDEKIVSRAHRSGAFGFLKKPFYPADVDALLERYYGLHNAMS